jgi:hypothetical protein
MLTPPLPAHQLQTQHHETGFSLTQKTGFSYSRPVKNDFLPSVFSFRKKRFLIIFMARLMEGFHPKVVSVEHGCWFLEKMDRSLRGV